MKDITLIDIATFIAFIVALIGGVEFLMARFKKVFDMQLKPLNSKIDNIELSNAKNFIVRTLADIEAGVFIDEVVKERFYENYEVYQKLGGNSYVKHKVEKLREEGKL